MPEGWLADGYGKSFITDSAVTDLPEPDSPTSATVSPFLSSNEMRSTASNLPLALPERDGEIADGEERLVHGEPSCTSESCIQRKRLSYRVAKSLVLTQEEVALCRLSSRDMDRIR